MVAAGLLATAIVVVGTSLGHAQIIPTDPQLTCIVKDEVFKSWFATGSVSLNGVVKPANGIKFPDDTNCDFYQWSEQMFLWLTSPAPDGHGRIIDSAEFYDVSLPTNGVRTFLPHAPGGPIRTFNLRSAQAGPHGLQLLFDRSGKMFEIAPLKRGPGSKPLVLNQLGKPVEVASARMEGGKAVFLDKSGQPIASPKPIPEALAAPAPSFEGAETIRTAYKFMIGKTPIFLDANGEVIDTAVGQAGSDGVLEAQNGSLVYYVTMANDVFAYFLTGTKTGGIKPAPTQFPTTQPELDKIIAFAASHGKKFLDPQALTIEVKSSWIDINLLEYPDRYITMEAIVPTYDRSNSFRWTPNGSKKTRLAMVGMHVVGSAHGNPEMLWATFEHFGSAPNAAYDYISATGTTKTVEQNTVGKWLFSKSGSAGPFNDMYMSLVDNAILAEYPHTVSPSNTLRMKPWGGAANLKPNGMVLSTAASNTEIISINNSVLGQLSTGDVRKNYFMMGNTWTKGGAAPTGSYPGTGAQVPGQEVGTSKLANPTMETYQQGTTLWATGSNCFTCHRSNSTSVSHVYPSLKPLF